MSDSFAFQVLLFAGEMAFASTLIVLLAWLAARGGSASRRHLTWSVAFGALLVLPVLIAVAPGTFVIALAASPPNTFVVPPLPPGIGAPAQPAGDRFLHRRGVRLRRPGPVGRGCAGARAAFPPSLRLRFGLRAVTARRPRSSRANFPAPRGCHRMRCASRARSAGR